MPHDQISVAALIRTRGGLVLARRGPEGAMAGRWELPGGKCEEGEGAGTALERELLEELGLKAEVGDLVAQDGFSHKGSFHQLLAFEVQADMEEAVLTEHQEWGVFGPGELPDEAQIVDSDVRILKKTGWL